VKEGKYHVVVRWSPKEGQNPRLGLTLAIGLADLQIPKKISMINRGWTAGSGHTM